MLLAITGGTGFVGQHVIRQALSAGHDVRALIRSPNKRPDISHDNLTWHTGALGDDDAGFVRSVDVLIHIAGLINARSRAEFDRVNVEASGALAAAAQSANVPRLILLSSMAAREPQLSDYAASKHAGEAAVRETFKGPLAIIRAPAVFGPGDAATAPFFKAVEHGILPVPGGKGWRHRRLSIVYAKDLARDIITAAVPGGYDGQTVSPASWPDVTWPGFARMLSEASGKTVHPVPLPLSLLYPLAGLTSVASRMAGKGHLTLGKLNEFLYQDWSSGETIQNAATPQDALRATLRYYKAQ